MKKAAAPSILVVMVLAVAVIAQAQQPKQIPRIGYLSLGASFIETDESFRQGLRELGYIDGHNIVIDFRGAAGKADRFAELAAELVRLKVDVVVATTLPAALAAKQATSAIPIVFVTGDPVRTGLVASLAHPKRNLTGLALFSPELSSKRLELLKETVPSVSRVAVLWNASSPAGELYLKETEVAAKSLGVQLQARGVKGSDDLDTALQFAVKERANGLLTLQGRQFQILRARIADFALKSRLPSMSGESEFAEAGGLMFYGASIPDAWKRAAYYVDRILKGTKPAELPVEQPTKFELVINLKTAKQIGLTIPPNVLARADKVIK